MNENRNEWNESVRPENAGEGTQQPAAQEPVQQPAEGAAPSDLDGAAQQTQYETYYSYSQPQYRSQPQYTPYPPQPPKKKQRVTRLGWRVAILAVCCALIGSLAGGAVVGGMVNDRIGTLSSQVAQLQNEHKTGTANTGTSGTVIPTGSASSGLSPAQIYSQNVDAVVAIVCETVPQSSNPFQQSQVGTSSGTGFLISADGEILTNYHVIEKARKITVALNDGTKYAATVVGYEAATDIALIKINGTSLPTVTLGDSDGLVVGAQVTAIGNALGTLNNTLTVGYVSALSRSVSTDSSTTSMIQVDAAINSGNSGGPLFAADGTVIGITSAKYSGTTSSGASIEGIGFAIPINDVKSILDDLRQNGTVLNRAYIGITVTNSTEPAGAEIVEIDESACGYKAGLRVGDVITALDGIQAESHTVLVNALRLFRAGDTATLTVVRDGQTLKLTVTFDAKPTDN